MDHADLARGHRRRQVLEALEFERSREAALREQIEAAATELEGPRIDERVFARMAPEDVDVVRRALGDQEEEVEEELDDDWLEYEAPAEGSERDELIAEIARLGEEEAQSRRRQGALEEYLKLLAET